MMTGEIQRDTHFYFPTVVAVVKVPDADALPEPGTDEAADERVRRAGGQPDVPGEQVPQDRAHQAAEHDGKGDDIDVDHALADGARDGMVENGYARTSGKGTKGDGEEAYVSDGGVES